MKTKFKCVILGDSYVGKTSIMNQYFTNVFKKNTETTLGAIFFSKKYITHNFAIDFWDTAGQERYRSLVPMYIRGANIILIVYDLNNRQSFESITYWLKLININDNPHIIIIGNKNDLEEKVLTEDINKLINSNNLDFFHIKLSAKNNTNCEELKSKILEIGLILKKNIPISYLTNLPISTSNNDVINKCCLY